MKNDCNKTESREAVGCSALVRCPVLMFWCILFHISCTCSLHANYQDEQSLRPVETRTLHTPEKVSGQESIVPKNQSLSGESAGQDKLPSGCLAQKESPYGENDSGEREHLTMLLLFLMTLLPMLMFLPVWLWAREGEITALAQHQKEILRTARGLSISAAILPLVFLLSYAFNANNLRTPNDSSSPTTGERSQQNEKDKQ